jgi:hypothetical protein
MTDTTKLNTTTALLEGLKQERAAWERLLERIGDDAWHDTSRADGWSPHDIIAHLADSNYGLALMTLGELQPALPLNDNGWMQVDDYNQQRRQKNAALPREKVVSRLASSFDHARRAIEATEALDAPGPYGPIHTKGMWLNRIVAHCRQHRLELETVVSSNQ